MRAAPTLRRSAVERRRDRRRMMREIVVDRDAAHACRAISSRRLHAAKRASAARPCATGTPTWRAAASAASAFSWLWRPSCAERAACPAARRPAESRRPRRSSSPGPVPGTSARPKRSTSLQQPRASTRATLASPPLATMRPVRRHHAHEMMELRLDRREIGEDVGVIVFEIVEDRGARPVVDELRALVEERRVVLVGLDDEERAVGEARRHAESPAARRRSGIPAPGPRARGSTRASPPSSSCRACPRPRAPSARRARSRRAIAARRRTAGRRRGSPPSADCRATRRCRSTNTSASRATPRKLRRVPAFGQVDAERLELRRHRRIDVGVAAGDAMAGGLARWRRGRP